MIPVNNQIDSLFSIYAYFHSLHVSESHVSIIRIIIVSMRHPVCVSLCRWPSGIQFGMKPQRAEINIHEKLGTAVAQWLRCCATNRKVAGSKAAGVIAICHWHEILPTALWPWGQQSLQQKWVPGAFLGGKGGRCVRLTNLPTSCAVVMKAGNLKFLEPSVPLLACNGTDLYMKNFASSWLFTRIIQICMVNKT